MPAIGGAGMYFMLMTAPPAGFTRSALFYTDFFFIIFEYEAEYCMYVCM